MDDRTKCQVFTKLLNALGKDGELNEEISESTYNDQVKLIRNELVSKVESDQETAMQMLHILIDNDVHSIQSDVVSIISDKNIDQTLRNKISDVIYNQLKDLLRTCNVMELSSFYNVWQLKFKDVLKELCNDDECKQYCKTFLLTTLIPLIMDSRNIEDPLKVTCINMALDFASVLSVAHLSSDDYNIILEQIDDYINSILKLRDNDFHYWHKLWMFLIRLLGKKLHSSMILMNKLLRVVEHAFKNSVGEYRLKGYDCWKELIDNASIDLQHMISERQMRLLLTPLRAKLSKQEVITVKRFEVFVYLLEKLQSKAVILLNEFLEFCFGNVGENTDPHKAGQFRSLPELWLKSSKVLMAILGHSHNENEICLQTDSDIHLSSPIVSSSNISGSYCHIIKSVAECSRLLKEVELGQHRNTVLRCLWKSLLNIILSDGVKKRNKCIEVIGKVLDSMLQENDSYCHGIAAIIFKEAVRVDESKGHQLIVNNLDRFLMVVFSIPLSKESYIDVESFLARLRNLKSPEESAKVLTHLFNGFVTHKTVETNIDFVAEVWLFIANKMEDYARGNSLDFLVWPLLHSHQLKEPVKKVSVYEHYQRLLVPFVERSDNLHLALFKYFEKMLKNNPLLLTNVLNVVTMFNPKTSHKDITNVTLEILAYILLVPATSDNANQRETIEAYLKKLYQTNVTKNQDQDTIKKLCTCMEHLFKVKRYGILTSLEESLSDLPENVKWLYAKFLPLDYLLDIFEKKTDLKVTKIIHNIIEHLRNVKNPETKKDITHIMPLGGRSAKIANLVKQIPASPNKTTTSPSTLRLFGKDVETHTPLKVVGSQLKDTKTTPKKSQTSTSNQKNKPATFIDDESNSKFVLIESEVKLDKGKLTEHQKETLKKRREDIPALYQDLSQSASQTFDSNSCSATKPNEADVFKIPSEFNFNEKPLCEDDNNVEMESRAVSKSKTANKSKKAKIESELKKLSMSIVGAKDFISAGSKRKRRERKLDEDDLKLGQDEKKRSNWGKSESIKMNDSTDTSNINKGNVKYAKQATKGSIDSDNFDPQHNDLEKTDEQAVDNVIEAANKLLTEQENANLFKSTESLVEDVFRENSEPLLTDQRKNQKLTNRVAESTNSKVLAEPIKMVPVFIAEPTQEKNKRNLRRSSVSLESFKEVRKSMRKSFPTEKVSQSEFFKPLKINDFSPQAFRKPVAAKISKNSQNCDQIELLKFNQPAEFCIEPPEGSFIVQTEKSTFNHDVEEDYQLINEKTQWPSKKSKNAMTKKSLPVEASENGFSRARKRKRPSSSEDDEDIIESSQESNISNISGSKVKWSANKSHIEKPQQTEASSTEEQTEINRGSSGTSLLTNTSTEIDLQTTINDGRLDEESNYSSEGSGKKRSRRRPSKSVQNTFITEAKKPNARGRKKGAKNTKKPQDDDQAQNTKIQLHDSPQNDVKNKLKKRGRRKRNLNDSCSTDISANLVDKVVELESSKKERRKSPRKQSRDNTIKLVIEQVRKQVFAESKKPNVDIDKPEKHTQSQDTQTQGSETLDMCSGRTELQLDLPQKTTLTESEQEIARMDTVSLPLIESEDLSVIEQPTYVDKTLIENNEDILNDQPDVENTNFGCSEAVFKPATDEIAETEELVRQLADRDIEVTMEPDHSSPVRMQTAGNSVEPLEASLPSSPVTGDTPNRTSELLSNTLDISPIGSKSGSDRSSSDDEFIEDRKLVPVALKFDQEDDELDAHKQKSPEKGDDAPQKMDEISPEKAEKEIEIIALESPPKTDAKAERAICASGEKAGRFNWVKQQGASATHRFFSRRRTSHNMSPSASRIKKLMSNIKPLSEGEFTDEISQEDILTFTREIPSPLAVPKSSILKRKHSETNDEGISPCAKRKRVNFSDPCTTSKRVFIKEDSASPSTCLFSINPNDDLDQQFLEVLAANDMVESPQIETEPNLQINNPMLLQDDLPIYPELIDCEESVSVISRKLTGPMFVNTLLSKLNGENIKTIGDLAKQSEISITQLPFMTPILATVYKTLDNYYHTNFKCKGSESELQRVCPPAEVTVDVQAELSKVLESARTENIPVETLYSVVLGSSDKRHILTWVRTHFNMEPHDMVEEKDYSALVRHITDSIGVPKIFEILTESSEEGMLQHSIEKMPLVSLIQKRSLQDLQNAIWENVENERYSKEELLNTCFLPYVYSIDLAPFFNKLTVVEVSDIVLNRLKTEDYNTFVARIVERCSNRETVRDEILRNYSVTELANYIIKSGPTQELTSSLKSIFLSASKEDKECLIDVFKMIGDLLVNELPASRLMELSVEFLKKIPIRD